MTSYCVYVARDANKKIIYVGMTLSLKTRISAHKRLSSWFEICQNIEIIHCKTKKIAADTERSLIEEFLPKFNKAFTGNAQRPKYYCSITRRKVAYEIFRSHLIEVFSKQSCNIEKDEVIARILSGSNSFMHARRDYNYVCKKICMPLTCKEYYDLFK
jgi:excinuclease UvrABC nuclease subunit